MWPRWLCLALLALLLAGCGGAPRRDVVPEHARAAEALYREGEFARAADAFLAAAAAQRARANYYRLRAAEAWREEGELDAAARILADADHRRLDATEALRMDLLQSELAIRAGDLRTAQDLLARPHDAVPERFRARYHDLAAQAWEVDDPFTAAAELASLQAYLPAPERVDNLRRIEALLVRVRDDVLARRTAALPPGHPLYRHAGQALSMRGLPLPRAYDRSIGWQQDGARPAADIDGYRPPRRVGLLLPDTGPLATAARAVREGFLAAYFEERRERPEVVSYDTGSTPEEALAAYRRAMEDGMDAVVGPLSRESVSAVFERGALELPVLALNRSTGAPPPPGSVSFALTPEEEGVAIAQRLAHTGARRVVAIAGEGETGQRSLSAFRARFESLGGEVASELRLSAGDPNYGEALSSAFAAAGRISEPGVDPDGNPTMTERYAADALFLAVSPDQARLLVPQLRILGIENVPIFATSAIHSMSGSAQLDRDLNGIVLTEAPWLLGRVRGLPDRRIVAESLPYADGPAARLIAFGIDAFQLLAYLEYLAEHPDAQLQGATGMLSIDGFGQVLRQPGWGEFRGGRVRPAREQLGDAGAH